MRFICHDVIYIVTFKQMLHRWLVSSSSAHWERKILACICDQAVWTVPTKWPATLLFLLLENRCDHLCSSSARTLLGQQVKRCKCKTTEQHPGLTRLGKVPEYSVHSEHTHRACSNAHYHGSLWRPNDTVTDLGWCHYLIFTRYVYL